MGKIALTGPTGEVRWGYRAVASLTSWALDAEAAGDTVRHSLTAAVRTHDAWAVTQRPLTFVVPRPNGHAWKWPITSLQIADQRLTAELGPQE